MEYEQGEQIISLLSELNDKIELLISYSSSMAHYIGFAIALAIACFVIYLILYPLKIFINGGYV